MSFALFYSDRVRSHMLTRRHVLTVAIYISLTLSLFMYTCLFFLYLSVSLSLFLTKNGLCSLYVWLPHKKVESYKTDINWTS